MESVEYGGIRLILETDSLVPPVTGIGRYTHELLKVFLSSEYIQELRCFSRGRWQNPEKLVREISESESAGKSSAAKSPRLGRAGSSTKIMLKRLLPLVQKNSLRRFSATHLYHSPNYRLTPFAGKKIATFHDLSLQKFPQFHPEDRLKILGPAVEQAALQADHLITDTEHVRAEIISYFGLPASKVTAIHLASSLNPDMVNLTLRNTFLHRLGLKPGAYFLFVSTLEPRKNIKGLLASFEMLPDRIRRQYPLVLAGQLGWNAQDLIEPLQRAKGTGYVIQPGFISNQELCYLYSGARAFVYPSIYEGFGLPVIEAQGFGVPVITSNQSCLPEVIGESGMLINPEDHVALAGAMEKIVEDDRLHTHLVQTGLRNWERFSWGKTANKTIQVYSSVLQT